jgi:hypothetical protein
VREVHGRGQPAAGDPDDELELEAAQPAREAAADAVVLAPRDVPQLGQGPIKPDAPDGG